MTVRSVFYISDGTGITAETLGHTLLTQFGQLQFNAVSLPFVDTAEKLEAVVARIERAAEQDGAPPLVFSTLIDSSLRDGLAHCRGVVFDFFDTFTGQMEKALGTPAAPATGRSHGMGNLHTYTRRINALHYALSHDDGAVVREYSMADVILVGVSRSGKTPTSLYLALQFGIQVANYPLTEEDFESGDLPGLLVPYRSKLFGLTVDPERLQQIRSERRPGTSYASAEQCRRELVAAEALFRRENIPYINVSFMSVEEIAATLLNQAGLKRRI
jgi:[pyruvate, water dikinase]-phosphate phosphotransferase / [pyruvate, water dikinase] kinase